MTRKDKEMRERLEAERDRLRREIEALQNQLLGVERSIALISGEGVTPEATNVRQRSRNVKDTALSLLAEAGDEGLTVVQLLDIAKSKGRHLDRGSVSSLLSRLKREHVLDMMEGVYRIKKPSADVVGLRTQAH